jgi:hypothetical protein
MRKQPLLVRCFGPEGDGKVQCAIGGTIYGASGPKAKRAGIAALAPFYQFLKQCLPNGPECQPGGQL